MPTQDETPTQDEMPTQDKTPTQDETRAQDEEQPVSGDQTVTPQPSIANPTTTDPNDPDNDWISHPEISDLIFRHLLILTFMVIFWTADRDPFGKTSKALSGSVLILTGFGTPVLILSSLMVDTIFAERKPTFHDNMKVVVQLYSIATLLFQISSIFATITYCLLPLLIIGALAARFWS
jgi:hypothetical protein